MTQLTENILMLVKTVSGFKGKTIRELIAIPDCWLNRYSEWGVNFWAGEGYKRGWLREKENKDGEFIYYATREGLKQYRKQISDE